MFNYGRKVFSRITSLITKLDALTTVVPALKTTTIQEDLFIQGKSFSYEDYLTYAEDEVKTFILDTSAFLASDLVNLTFNPLVFAASKGPVLIQFYYGSTYDLETGEELKASNRRATSSNTNLSKWILNPDNVSLGTRFTGDMVPSTGLDDKTAKGSIGSGGLPFELNSAVNYAMTITNTNGADTYIETKATWFES